MDKKTLIDLINAIAGESPGADYAYGVCMAESNLNPYAVRYEPNFKWLWKPREVKPAGCSMDTETALQRTSIGLMQVMGAVYREMGYKGWLTEILASPKVQLTYGCDFLFRKIKKYGLEAGICAYNSGSPRYLEDGKTFVNQYYLDRVLRYSSEWKSFCGKA
jgi:hypothetical protein